VTLSTVRRGPEDLCVGMLGHLHFNNHKFIPWPNEHIIQPNKELPEIFRRDSMLYMLSRSLKGANRDCSMSSCLSTPCCIDNPDSIPNFIDLFRRTTCCTNFSDPATTNTRNLVSDPPLIHRTCRTECSLLGDGAHISGIEVTCAMHECSMSYHWPRRTTDCLVTTRARERVDLTGRGTRYSGA